MPGPVPKREAERRRRNKPEPVTSVVSDGTVRGPDLTGRHSAVGRRWYEALRRSGQSQFYEPSDWAFAELLVVAVDAFAGRPTAAMLSALGSAMSGLLVCEGDRRRVRLELQRPEAEAFPDASALDEYRRRLRGVGGA